MKIEQIHKILNTHFQNEYSDIFLLKEGVMTYKYKFRIVDKYYIIRIYPKGRNFLADAEFGYLKLLYSIGVIVPNVILKSSNNSYYSYIIYEMLEGFPLTRVFDGCSVAIQKRICNEIYDNYLRLSTIKASGVGIMLEFDEFSDISWKFYLQKEIDEAYRYVKERGVDININRLEKYTDQFILSKITEKKELVWSDFSGENIILSDKGDFKGFIDFEGLMGGDSLLGYGYLKSRSSNCLFCNIMSEFSKVKDYSDYIDFYAVIRYLRLIKYIDTKTPNGSTREPINVFLKTSFELIKKITS